MTKFLSLEGLKTLIAKLKSYFAAKGEAIKSITGSGNRVISYIRADNTQGSFSYQDTTYGTGNTSTAGLTKLYTSLGGQTDGAPTNKLLNDGLQTLVERIKSCYLLEIGVSGGAGAIMVDSTADQAEINAIVEGNAPMPIAVKLHMADNDTDYIVNTCQVRGGYFMLYIPDDMVLTDIDGTEFTGTWMTFMADSFTAAVDYYATSVDLRNSTQVITDTSKATSSNVLYLVADSSKNVSGVVYNSKTYTFAAEKGEKGDKGDTGATGVGITSVKQTVASMISGDTNVVEITTSDGKTSQVKIRNGNASTSGTEIVQTTGTATDKVMSQKSVTDALDFPRVTLKVTFLTEVIKGKQMNGGGNLVNNATHCTTCHIPCEGAHKVELLSGDTKDWNYIVAFDKDNKVVANAVAYNNTKKYALTTPATTTYVVATYLADTTNDRGVWIDGVKAHEPVPDDIEIKHEGGDKEYYLMSQKGVQDYVNQRLMDSAQSHSSFGSGFCYRLNARQIELLEASDVITLEICAQCNGGLNEYNNTAGMTYFKIMFGNNHAAFSTTNDGAYAFTGDSKLNPLSGTAWQLAATQTGVEPRMPNDRVLMVIDRKQGIVRLYDKCSRKIIECQRDAYKCDSWLAGDDWLAIMTGAPVYVADLWALRIYDRDVTVLQYDNNFRVKDAHMTEAILPFQHPLVAKTIDVNDWVIERFDKATAGSKPYYFPGNYSYDPDDGLLTGTNDATDWAMIGPGSSKAGNLYGIIDVDFEVTGGKWRVAKQTAIKVYAITKSDGTDMGIEGIMGSDRTELEAGRYTMSYISFNFNAFCDIAPGTKIKMHSMHQHTLHCVANINPKYYCNMQCWDDARGEWWTPLNVNNHSTPVVPTFSDAAWRSVPAPALLSQPSYNGQLKIDDSGKVYVGVCVGANRTWKQINNT